MFSFQVDNDGIDLLPQFCLPSHDTADLGVERLNIHSFTGIGLFNVARYGDVVAVGRNVTVLHQPREMLDALASGEGVENLSLVFRQ